MNGYFQLIRSESGISVKVIPPTEGGSPVSIDVIKSYMERNQIQDCNYVKLDVAMRSMSGEVTAPVTSYVGYPVNEQMEIILSEDKMTATVRFYPPSNDGNRIDEAELRNDLVVAGVRYGVDFDILSRHVANPVYCTEYVIARGKEVREGSDAFITYHFETDRKAKPKRNEDGSVDFHQLGNISHIKKGDLLATLTPEDRGTPGVNVLGIEVAPRSVERTNLKYGRNIRISEDKKQIFSDVDGHVVLEGDKVFVSNVYEVPADVDNSTGDISYEGNVLVRGNVRTGFKIQCSGDVEVLGAVEGATIVAGGQVVLHHGMQGMSKGMIVAKGNIITKFIESSRIHSEGFVESEAIIQSQVAAKGDIVVKGAKGNIIGGHVRSGTLVEAKTVGSPMGIATEIEVGLDPTIQDRYNQLKQDMVVKNQEVVKLMQVGEVLKKKLSQGPLDQEKVFQYKKMNDTREALKKEIFDMQDELDALTAAIAENEKAKIVIGRDVFPGTKIIVAGVAYQVNEQLAHCQFVKSRGDVKSTPI